MKIGIVGYQLSGKSTLFQWLTGIEPDPALSHKTQSAMAVVPDGRIEPLCKIYQPKKITQASLELVDTPGLARDHEGNPARLGMIREAGCLVMVVSSYDSNDPAADLGRFAEDLILADLEIVTGRVERLRESVKKPRPDRDQQQAELAALEPLLAILEDGRPLDPGTMSEEQLKTTRSFRLFAEKPRLVVVNVADDETQPQRFLARLPEGTPAVAIPLGLELELTKMSPQERDEFLAEMGLTSADRDSLIRTILDVSGQFLYFTAGDKEVRSWMLHKGGTALEAADNIHTDLARGFIRAETMTCDDLIRLGSEREIKAHNLMRSEPKDYVVQDGDILHIRFSV